ncbi:SPFH domain-containing protein [Streptomyces sp. NPDC056399]|uniref:SPFH domain-containing protein n=1 Tax=Streptomyces sp. NPDC056399 TaxID=3345807 RepID=UPI0035E1C357
MTASTPNPADSGAAASRDAARTARRLTDGTLPRTSPPQGAPPGTPPTRRETAEEPREPGELSESRDGAPAEGGAPSPDDVAAAATAAAAAVDDAPTSAAQDVAPVRPGAAPGGASDGTSDGAPVGQAPAPESPAAGEPAPSAPAAGEPVTTSRARVPVWPEPGARGGAAAAATRPEAPTRPEASATPEARTEPTATSGPAASTGPTAPTTRITLTAPTTSTAPTAPDGAEPGRGTEPAGASPRDEAKASGASPVRPLGSTPPVATVPPVATAPPVGAASASGTASSAPAAPVITRVQPVPPAYPGTTPSGAGRHARPHSSSSSSSSSSSFKTAVTVRSGGPSPVPAAVPAVAAAPTAAPAAGPASDRPADRPSDRPATPDFGRIAGAGVGAVAVPVAAVVRVARRKNVIGAETTGSIPVHLLFRDQPGNAVPFAAGEDDGGPDTVAMAAPTLPRTGAGAAIPGPSKVQAQDPEQLRADAAGAGAAGRASSKRKSKSPSKAELNGRLDGRLDERLDGRLARRLDAPLKARSASRPGAQDAKAPASAPAATNRSSASRPAPTADPALVERPGPVLPGWVGVVGGALALAACAAVVWWAGAVPEEASRMLRLPERPYNGIHLGQWALLALGVVLTLFALGGLGRGRVGYAWVLTLFGDYRGTVRRTGLVWVSPLLLRRRVDVRLRHWRSEPLSAVDAKGTALDVTVLVVWRVRDTVRAALGVDGHEDYLREQVEAAMARVLSQLPADAFHEDAPTLRDAEAVGEALTRMLSAECAPVGVDVFSAQPTRIEYAPDVAAAMRRRRIAAIDAKHRDSVLTSVVDAVDDVVHRLTSRGLVELDDYERKALVKDLTVAFYTGRTGPVEGA